jgi:hypothetical protein
MARLLIVARSSSIFGERDIIFESKNVGTQNVEVLGLGVDSSIFTGTQTL